MDRQWAKRHPRPKGEGPYLAVVGTLIVVWAAGVTGIVLLLVLAGMALYKYVTT